ncbi:MAG TPA: fucose-binding lectin II [Dyella sp.]|uniref:fucose-binding lectin II n=1 Tax=Dyella sp. TaxID=1869338 RepID=UPI002F94CEC0
MLKEITDFSNKDLNGWTPRLDEFNPAHRPNWILTDNYYKQDLGGMAFVVPTQDLVDNSGTVLGKHFDFVAGATYEFSVHTLRLNNVKPFPELSLRVGATKDDAPSDRVITSATPDTGAGTWLTGSFKAEKSDAYLKIFNSVSGGSGNDFCITEMKVTQITDDCDCKCGGTCGDNPNGGKKCFKLPANTDFALNALINSAATQTIKVYIDGEDKPSHTLTGSGLKNVNPGQIVAHTKTGQVCVEVSVNGKMSKWRFADNPLDNKPGFIVLGTEDGSDNDYNDTIVFINWGLG